MNTKASRFIRYFSTSQPRLTYGPPAVQRTTLMNGIRVASAKSDTCQMGACTIMFQAGSRYEYDTTRGVSHFLRSCSGASGCGYSPFSKMRVLHQHGSYITVSNDRQSIAYTLRCPPCVFDDVQAHFMDIAARCCYQQHDVNWRKNLVRLDWQRSKPAQRAIDLVQKACWGGPLSNSLFCEPELIDSMTAEKMNWFLSENYRSDVCTVASVGLPFEKVLQMAEKVEITREQPAKPRNVEPSSPRHGFEVADMGPGSDTWIAVGVPGCGNKDLATLMTYSLLAATTGTDNVKQGQHKLDRWPQAPVGNLEVGDVHTTFKTFNISFCDTGIFGIITKSPSKTAREAAFCAAGFLKSLRSIDADHVEVGRRRLKVDMALHDDNCTRMCEGLALQANEKLHMDSGAVTACMLDSIPATAVLAAAAEVAKSASTLMALGACGDEQVVPNNYELMEC